MRESVDRTERLLTLLVLQNMKGATQREKAIQLNIAGFSNVEIANLLDTTPQSITQVLYESRKTSGKNKKKTTQKAGTKSKGQKRTQVKRARGKR